MVGMDRGHGRDRQLHTVSFPHRGKAYLIQSNMRSS